MALAELYDDGLIHLDTDLREGDLCAALPGSKWVDAQRQWVLPPSWPAAVQLRGVFGAHLRVGERLNEWLWELRQRWVDPCMALRQAHDSGLTGPTAERLYPLQRVAAHFGHVAERALIGDKPGCGKTWECLAAVKLNMAVHGEDAVFPALVVCPNKVRRSWANLIPQVFPDAEVLLLSKTAAARRKDVARLEQLRADGVRQIFVVVNWEGVMPVSRLEPFGNITMTDKEREPKELNAVQWGTVVADEAHHACDRKAKQTRAIKAVAFGTPSVGTGPARFRYAMTGTPVANNSADLWSIMNFLDPVAWPAYSKFVDRYATTAWNEFGGLVIGGVNPETAEELYKALDPYFICRPKSIVLPHLAEKPPPEILYVEMAPKQKKAYESMRDEMLAEVEGGVLVATSPLVKSSRLVALAQGYGEMVDKGRRDVDGGVVLDLLLSMPSCKVDAMLEIVEERPDEQLVFFAESRQLIGLCELALQKRKRQYSVLVGGQSDAESEEQERAFETGRTRIMLATIGSSGEGINSLVVASTLTFLQRSWSMVKNEQVEDRIHREGQKADRITILDVVAEGTVEEWQRLVLEDKTKTLEEICRDAATLESMLRWSR